MTDLVNFTGNLPAFWKNGTKSKPARLLEKRDKIGTFAPFSPRFQVMILPIVSVGVDYAEGSLRPYIHPL